MLHSGLSLAIFEEWCTNELNMIIMPGYCVAGTVGHKILNGARKLEIKKGKVVEVKMSVQYMSFSAHADAKGIMQLISYCEPRSVMLVHGEAAKMEFLKQKIKQEHGVECYMPANGETAKVPTPSIIPCTIATKLLRDAVAKCERPPLTLAEKRPHLLHGVLVMRENGSLTLVDADEACTDLGLAKHTIRFTSTISLTDAGSVQATQARLAELVKASLADSDYQVAFQDGEISVSSSVLIKVEQNSEDDNVKDVIVSWAFQDEHLGAALFNIVQGTSK
jgi:integrator complex subunit 11